MIADFEKIPDNNSIITPGSHFCWANPMIVIKNWLRDLYRLSGNFKHGRAGSPLFLAIALEALKFMIADLGFKPKQSKTGSHYCRANALVALPQPTVQRNLNFQW